MANASPDREQPLRLRSAIARAVDICARTVQRHPYTWKIAWDAIHRLPFLLPHDKSYDALRHFIAIKPSGLFLDIGANDGISALSFRKYSKNYRILSLEPNPLLEPALMRIRAADPNFDYKITAAGASAGRLTFFVPTYNSIVLHTFTSRNRDYVLKSVTNSFGPTVAGAIEIKSFDSEIVQLDELSLNPEIVKIDAEGFDYAILQGLRATILRARPFFMIEVGADELADVSGYFSKLDYMLLAYNVTGRVFNPVPLSSDRAISDTWGNRNLFAVPTEFLGSIPRAPA